MVIDGAKATPVRGMRVLVIGAGGMSQNTHLPGATIVQAEPNPLQHRLQAGSRPPARWSVRLRSDSFS